MRPGRTICEIIHLGALGLALGAMVITGAAAAIAFPVMKALDPHLPAFAAYGEPHWPVAAGSVMNRLFGVTDAVLLGAAIVAALTLGASRLIFRARFASIAGVLRLIALAALLGSVGLTRLDLRPRMQSNLTAYWEAARAGDAEAAARHKAAFDADHPRASFLLVTQLVLAAWAFGAGAWHALRDDDRPCR